jgi:lactoylglutathione lyase
MNFCWVTLKVGNMENSMKFYNGVLGLPVSMRMGGGGHEIVMLGDADKPKIELLYDESMKAGSPGNIVSVGIAVPSLEETMELMRSNGIDILRGPVSPAPNVRFFFVRDPDGVEVQLVESR